MEWNDVGIVSYKSGDIERQVCQKLGLASRTTSHDPLEELQEHFTFLRGKNLI